VTETVKRKRKARLEKGSGLVEILISVGILSFVIVSILSGFSQQQLNTRNTASKNLAVRLAEMKIEEVFKFPSANMQTGDTIDYVIPKPSSYEIMDTNPNEQKQYRRTVTITMDFMGQMADVTVTVDYPLTGSTYPNQVVIKTRRGAK
jgi:type II secretory pathway pseudopilin PulG